MADVDTISSTTESFRSYPCDFFSKKTKKKREKEKKKLNLQLFTWGIGFQTEKIATTRFEKKTLARISSHYGTAAVTIRLLGSLLIFFSFKIAS